MNKKKLIASIAEKSNLTPAEAALKATFNTIQAIIVEQDSVAISGFGSFGSKIPAERRDRNPATGKEMLIPKTIVPVFKAASQQKASVNAIKDKEE